MPRTQILPSRSDRLRDGDRQDSASAAEARVLLKLAAEGYNASRYGADGGGRLTAAALARLRNHALAYYARLSPQAHLTRRLPPDLRDLHERTDVDQAFAHFQVAAIAYSNTRAGADACSEFTRSAIGALCDAATLYVDVLLDAADHTDAPPRRGAYETHEDAPPDQERDRRAPLLGSGT